MKLKLIHCLFIAALMVLFSSCGSSRTVTGSLSPEQLASMTIDQRYNALVDGYKEWKTLSVPVKVELSQPKKFSISGRAYMVKDKSLFISLKFLGMEVGTVYMTKDSIFVTEKIHKYYVAEDLSSLLGGYQLSVGDVQSLLLGQPFIWGGGAIGHRDKKKLDLKENYELKDWSITPKKPIPGISYWFTINNSNELKKLTVTTNRHAPAHVVYSEPMVSIEGAGGINDRLTIQANAGRTNVSATLKWNFQKAKWNEKELREWKRPKGDYKRLGRSQLERLLLSF